MTNGERLRELLAGDTIIMAPGAYDAWSAKLVAQAGFPAVYMTGYGVSASTLGAPDIGLISFKEMLDAAQNIVRSAGIAALCDADTGFGGRLNVMRTVEAYENAGVAAIQLEDQGMPKRCGHMEGKQLISTEEMVAKLKIAQATRKDPSLCIIARTDATAVEGFAAALERAKAYEAAGADIIFMEALTSREQMREACAAIRRFSARMRVRSAWVRGRGRHPPAHAGKHGRARKDPHAGSVCPAADRLQAGHLSHRRPVCGHQGSAGLPQPAAPDPDADRVFAPYGGFPRIQPLDGPGGAPEIRVFLRLSGRRKQLIQPLPRRFSPGRRASENKNPETAWFQDFFAEAQGLAPVIFAVSRVLFAAPFMVGSRRQHAPGTSPEEIAASGLCM